MQLVNEQVNVGEYEEVKIGEGEGINISVEFTGKKITGQGSRGASPGSSGYVVRIAYTLYVL